MHCQTPGISVICHSMYEGKSIIIRKAVVLVSVGSTHVAQVAYA